mmetsp:Transcript_39900/g.112766  ORF Transcript_39900/g.112766 Transcript_39900/m.112766 type:complete len:258 (-) Transcript_39900:298-1071(-)
MVGRAARLRLCADRHERGPAPRENGAPRQGRRLHLGHRQRARHQRVPRRAARPHGLRRQMVCDAASAPDEPRQRVGLRLGGHRLPLPAGRVGRREQPALHGVFRPRRRPQPLLAGLGPAAGQRRLCRARPRAGDCQPRLLGGGAPGAAPRGRRGGPRLDQPVLPERPRLRVHRGDRGARAPAGARRDWDPAVRDGAPLHASARGLLPARGHHGEGPRHRRARLRPRPRPRFRGNADFGPLRCAQRRDQAEALIQVSP